MQSPQAKIPGGGPHVRINPDIPVRIAVRDAGQEVRVRRQPDEDENPFRRNDPDLGGVPDVLDSDPLHEILPLDRLDDAVPGEGDLRMGKGALGQDARRPQALPPVYEGHLVREARQIERLLNRRVPAADHDHVAIAVEGAVAGRAVRDAPADEFLLPRDAQAPPVRPRRDDHGKGVVRRSSGLHPPAGRFAPGDGREGGHVPGHPFQPKASAWARGAPAVEPA